MRRLKDRKVIFDIIAMIILIAYRDIGNGEVPFVIFSAVTALTMITCKSHERIIFMIAMLPFCRGIPYSEMVVIALLREAVSIAKARKAIIRWFDYSLIILIVMIEIVDYIVFSTFSNEFIYLALYMIYVTYVINTKRYVDHEKECITLYALSTITAVLMVIIREIIALGLDYIMVYNVRFGANEVNSAVTSFNSNELGLYCGVAIAALLVLYQTEKKTYDLIIAVCLTLLGLVSVSRTYILIVLFIWLLFLLKAGANPKILIATVILIGVAVFAIMRFFPSFSEWILKYYEQRSNAGIFDGFGGRSAIMKDLFDYVFDGIWPLLFGYSEMYVGLLGVGGAHNGLQEMMVCWGIVGFVVASCWIISLFLQVRKISSMNITRKLKKFKYLPFGVFMLFVQTLQLFTMHNYLVLMMFTLISLSVYEVKNETRVERSYQ